MSKATGVETNAAAKWARHVEQLEKSGLSVRKFAAHQGLKAGTLSFWKWKLAQREPAGREWSRSGSWS